MLRVAEHWADSDLGRQRRGNEDSFYVRAPLFVVADGMGGAQAGEVASATAVRAFERGVPGGAPTKALASLIAVANREIHDRSRADRRLAGMGTTLTAAYLAEDDAVVVAHVGDSRCYLLRDGDLVRLTRDHSLVGELVARGKLTEEQAEMHPQRSVITRALGPEPQVEADVDVFPARAGDVFMLCSDGLTSMVPEHALKPILDGARSLERAGRELISAANAAGGRDNITVVLFRVDDVDAATRADAVPGEATTGRYAAVDEPTAAHEVVERDPGDDDTRVHAAVPGGDAAEAASADEASERRYRRGATVAMDAVPEDHVAHAASRAAPRRPVREIPGPAPPTRRGRRGRGVLKGLLVVGILLTMVAGAGISAARAVYFIGTDVRDGRTITIFRGLPYELPFGIELYTRYAGSGVTLDAVPPSRRAIFTDHKLRSRDDAEELVIELERGRLNR